MDIATHALTSFAISRGLFPQRGWPVTVGIVLAGTLADVDLLSVLFGPAAYLAMYRTVTHSIVAAVVFAVVCALVARMLQAKYRTPQKTAATQTSTTFGVIMLACSAAAGVHLLMDLGNSDGETLLWPFRATRFAADILPSVDPWILFLLIAAIVVPALFQLVNSEIGAKDKGPRGRNSALIVLALLIAYSGARYALHVGAVAQLDAHSYRGESPRVVSALPSAISLSTWHGIVETNSLLCLVEVPAGGDSSTFNAESANCQHKPDYSSELALAQKTPAATAFLQSARFPRATVEKTVDGTEVVIRSLRDLAEQETSRRVATRIVLDGKTRVLSDALVWVNDLPGKR